MRADFILDGLLQVLMLGGVGCVCGGGGGRRIFRENVFPENPWLFLPALEHQLNKLHSQLSTPELIPEHDSQISNSRAPWPTHWSCSAKWSSSDLTDPDVVMQCEVKHSHLTDPPPGQKCSAKWGHSDLTDPHMVMQCEVKHSDLTDQHVVMQCEVKHSDLTDPPTGHAHQNW